MKFNFARALLNNQIVITAVNSKNLVNRAIKLLDLSPISADALGRTLTVAALMGGRLKNKDDYLSITINGGGKTGAITACCKKNRTVKATIANPTVENIYTAENKLDTAKSIGCDGKITVIKSVAGYPPYVGSSKLISGNLAEDFAYYFATSEQQPCALTIGLSFKNGKCHTSGGVLIEVLPNCESSLLSDVETVVYAMDEMSWQFVGSTPREIIERFFGHFKDLTILEESLVRYKCDCGIKKIEKVVLSLGKKDAEDLVSQMGKVEVQCHFCNKKYEFYSEQIESLFERNKK